MGDWARQTSAACPFGKASRCFPLAIGRDAALGVMAAAESSSLVQQTFKRSATMACTHAMEGMLFRTDVAGYTTTKTQEAGASSVRLTVRPGQALSDVGAYLVALRAPGRAGWLPGLAAPRCGGGAGDATAPAGLEVVVFGRADVRFSALMFLPEDTLRVLFPNSDDGTGIPDLDDDMNDDLNEDSAEFRKGKDVEVLFLRHLLPVQNDCPPQWLADRLLRLADAADEAFSSAGRVVGGLEEIRCRLERAGLEWVAPEATKVKVEKMSEEEMGAWKEEMRSGQVCAAGVEVRPDYEQGAPRFDLVTPNLYIAPKTVKFDVSASGGYQAGGFGSLIHGRQLLNGEDAAVERLVTPHSDTIRQIVGRLGASDADKGFNRQSTVEAGSPTNAHSNDRYDTRWLEFNGDTSILEPSGDGTIDNVGVNMAGTFCCNLCNQQFSSERAFEVHMKFTHQVEEVQGEWLSFPSA